jgi:hypothetical protein
MIKTSTLYSVLTIFVFVLSFVSCKDELPMGSVITKTCKNQDVVESKVYTKDGRTYLWASADSSKHFDITGWSLNVCRLNDYGFQRESIKSLRNPTYVPAADKISSYLPGERVMVVKGDDVTKIYPYQIMSYHEVVNDVVDGQPIMIAYCILANLAAVYSRVYCDKEFTFAVSGYTYADETIDNGVDAFVLWDRETESLWWPLIDVGVSGSMNNVGMRKFSQAKWEYSSWGEAVEKYPEALVIETQQEDEEPESWIHYPCEELDCCS